jgi:alpha-tubulin suppressor-like RCC1 family protein
MSNRKKNLFKFFFGIIVLTTVLLASCQLDESELDYSFVSFNGNGATTGSGPSLIIGDVGEIIKLPATYGGFSRENKYIASWNTKADGTGVEYECDESFTLGSEGTNLYAQWENVITKIIMNNNSVYLIRHDGTLFGSGLSTNTTNIFGISYSRDNYTAPIAMIDDVVSAGGGSAYSLVQRNDGTIWGQYNNYYNRNYPIGSGPFSDYEYVQLTGEAFTDITEIYTSNHCSFLVKDHTRLFAAGYNGNGQLGTGSTTSPQISYIEVDVNGDGEPGSADAKIIDIKMSSSHTVILKDDGTIWTCGSNSYGQLGYSGGSTMSFQQVDPSDIGSIISIGTTTDSTLVINDEGNVWVVGKNYYGELGTGNKSAVRNEESNIASTFKQLNDTSLPRFKAVYSNSQSSMLLSENDELYVSGYNINGGFGDGTKTDSYTFKKILEDVDEVYSNNLAYSNIIKKNDNTLWVSTNGWYSLFGQGTDVSYLSYQKLDLSQLPSLLSY